MWPLPAISYSLPSALCSLFANRWSMIISLIAAMERNRLIGAENRLPWHLPADLKHFKTVTMGKPIIMGRNTFESLGRPLPGRHNIVVTRDRSFKAEGCTVVHSIEEALSAAEPSAEAMVIGGATLYAEFVDQAQRMYLTLIDGEFEGDTLFPAYDANDWREMAREDFEPDEQNPYRYSFVVLDRLTRGSSDTNDQPGRIGSC